MPAEKLEQFGGMLPAWGARLLPTGQAASASNGYLFSGELTGWRQPKLLRALQNSAARFVFRIPTVSETQALAYLIFIGTPNPGDTFTVGDLTYTWASPVVNPYDVFVGATPAACALNALAALTADNGTNQNEGVLYGNNTAQNGAINIYPPDAVPLPGLPAPSTGTVIINAVVYPYVEIGAPDFGVAYNETEVAESTGNARTTWLKDLLSINDTTSTFAGGTNQSFDNTITGNATWLEFLDQDTKVLRSQVVDDRYNRWYFSSPTQPPTYNTYDRITSGKPAWLLGVPAPGCSPSVTVTGGGNTLTLGNPTGDGGSTGTGANNVFLTKVTPTGATTIQDVQFNAQFAASAANYAAVVYLDANGAPGQLLYAGEILTGIVAGANTAPFVNPPLLLNETPYWIGFMTDTALATDTAAGNNTVFFPNTFSNGPPLDAPATTPMRSLFMFGDFNSSDVQEARSYVYTWVSQYGEEGPPAPATLNDGWSNGVWTIGVFSPNANDLGVERNLAYLNIYRTVVGTSGSTVFFYVATLRLVDWAFSLVGITGPWYGGTAGLPLPTDLQANGVPVQSPSTSPAVFVDTLPDNLVSLNNEMISATWFPPPTNLQGMVSMPNGVFAGWKNNEVWFCQPYQPHAWPPGYVITTDFPVIGLGVMNGALAVLTSTTPYVILGSQPANMAALKCDKPQPCISRGSILSGDNAVTFMSPNGLIQVTPAGQAINTTDLWFTREKWQTLTPQKYARAIEIASSYFCFGTTAPLGSPSDNSVAQSGFTIELAADAQNFTIWPQPGGHRLGFMPLTSHVLVNNVPQNIDNVEIDPWTGIGMLVSDGSVYFYDFSDASPVPVPYDWVSKTYQNNAKKNYSAFKLFFKVPPGVPAPAGDRFEAEPTDPGWATLGPTQYAVVKTYADIGVDADGNLNGAMVLIDCKEVRRSGEMLRLPSDFKAEQWQWEIVGRVVVTNLQVATSAKELANV